MKLTVDNSKIRWSISTFKISNDSVGNGYHNDRIVTWRKELEY